MKGAMVMRLIAKICLCLIISIGIGQYTADGISANPAEERSSLQDAPAQVSPLTIENPSAIPFPSKYYLSYAYPSQTDLSEQISTPEPKSTPSNPPDPSGCASQPDSPYILPYPVGITHLCILCIGSRYHHAGGEEFAYDFSMPIGSKIIAARSGKVIFVREKNTDKDFELGKENAIVIQHTDMTFGRYLHLTKNGAHVKVGQEVEQGQVIGLSGNSGISYSPHLHFDVMEKCAYSGCQTLKVCFKNTASHPNGLETGILYTADPY